MQTYKLKNKENYKYFVKHYLEVMKEGKEAEAFLGTEAKYRFRQRDSYELDSTDISVLMEYCLYPLYVEGDKDIVRRTFEILKDFSLSVDLVKLDKVTDYIFIQNRRLKRYISLPFVIKTDELVRNIIESISNLSDEQKKDWLYQGLCNALDRDPLYRQCDEEKVEKILKEFKEKYYNPPKVVETIKTVEEIVLDVTSIDAMGVSDDHLELLRYIKNKRRGSAQQLPRVSGMVGETRKIDLEGIHQGLETVKSVGKNVSDFFNGGLKAASSLFG